MHSCEALIAAFEATNQKKYLNRALLIAKNICVRQANLTEGLINMTILKALQARWIKITDGVG